MKFFIDTANLEQIREAQDLGVLDGSKINFLKDSEYEFDIDGEILYRMRSSDICAII